MQSKSKWLLSSFIFSLGSLLTHIYLTYHTYAIKFGASDGQSLCNINSVFNCDTVAASVYSQIFGIPIALFGAITHFVLLIFLVVYALNLSINGQRILHASLWLSAYIALVSVVMGFVSFSFLNSYCLFCLLTYAFSFIILFSLWKANEPRSDLSSNLVSHFVAEAQGAIQEQKWIFVLLGLIPVVAALGHSMISDTMGFKNLDLYVEESFAEWKSGTLYDFDKKAGVSTKTLSEPKATLVEFADFLCPHCKEAGPTLIAFTATRPELQLIYKFYPLDGNCNKGFTQKGDGLRCDLAYFAYCSEQIQSSGWAAIQFIFENQRDWSKANFEEKIKAKIALQKWNEGEILDCIKKESTFEAIIKMAEEGNRAQIRGTPTIFLNGRQLPRAQFLPILREVYQRIEK